ncbi:sensor domain-containing diguanylate cyclase [Comamonas sp. 17RB]|uniref:sensor domain-containing diguanylate cyclase n=1 Tax=Comamonas sp. 17RB TaxID=3047025 RepID=UPI0024B87150|nr:sensor domain-containing diguanylate cyclase [Comamonas sp. 17RB]MDI9854045.1 diguanylate cyclase [Comamonas sp. 17RB]
MRSSVRMVTLGVALAWLALVASIGWWMSQRIVASELDRLAASAEYEAKTTARIMDRLFTEMVSVANMVARQGLVIQLATRYRTDPPDLAELTRQQRAAQFTQDPLVRKVGDFMDALSGDLRYARIYMNNMSDDTVTASNWAESDSIVGMIYSGRPYLVDALREGNGHSFGIARLNKTPSYFVASRIESEDDQPLGSVTVKFDAPDMVPYLSGSHIALILDRQGRVTTTSSAPFMLRNASALLPPGSAPAAARTNALDSDEQPGEPLDVRAVTGSDLWIIDGKPYLLRHEPLSNTQYQLITLASLDHLPGMRRLHLGLAGLVASVGLLFILLCGHVIGLMVERRQDEWYAANHDALTDLPNRRNVLGHLEQLFAQAKKTQQWVVVAFVDLDGFKAINDTYGHEVGDQFLVEVGRRLTTGLRQSDMLGRLGGDEFVVIGLIDPASPTDQDQALEAMRSRLAPLLIGRYAFPECSLDYPGASFGIVSVDPSISSTQTVLREADLRMYADKQARRTSRREPAKADAACETGELPGHDTRMPLPT